MAKPLLFHTDHYSSNNAPGKASQFTGAGAPWPSPRFQVGEGAALDILTGLTWTLDAAESMFPMKWSESLSLIDRMNRINAYGFNDWRLPNRREVFSLLSHSRSKPALPEAHPFNNVFMGFYWTSTTLARLSIEAWCVNISKGKVETAVKHSAAMMWPVRGGDNGAVQLAWTGQKLCYSPAGTMAACDRCGQDGELRHGAPWPSPRFTQSGPVVLDLLTGLEWTAEAKCSRGRVKWEEAFDVVESLNRDGLGGLKKWRLPTIRELESITDMGAHSPAIARGYPFKNVQEWYWSSSSSAYDPAHAWILETTDGHINVHEKDAPTAHVWAVRS